MDQLDCEICARPHSQQLPFFCAVDARNQLYEGRVQSALALMQNQDLERQVNTVLSSASNPVRKPQSSKILIDKWQYEQAAAADRTSQIIALGDRLKIEVDAARKELEERRRNIGRRRSDLESASNGIDARKVRLLDETERSMQLTRVKWNRNADSMAATRAFLCEEAARLYGLRQVKKGKQRRYEIGGVEVVELHAMNNMAPEVISTGLAHIAHIVMLASHYLTLRLPAEITLPHRDYPRPTIFSLTSSYRHGEISFPGSGLPSQLSLDSRGGDQQHTPRPRPLYVDKPLPVLAKEDPATYALFLEGVTLLAYNIAWTCCTQGVSFGDRNSYDDVCNMGQNLWQLLIGDQLYRKSVEPAFPSSLNSTSDNPKEDGPAEIGKSKAQMGRWSHGTTHAFLGGAEGSEFVRNFKLLNPTKLVDRLKKKLSTEVPMLEWEKIDGDEARAVEQEYDDGVLIRGRRRGSSARRDREGEGIRIVRAAENGSADNGSRTHEQSDMAAERNRTPGTSGWTKLKNR